MQREKLTLNTILIFFLVLFLVPLFWAIRGANPERFSVIENRTLAEFSLEDRLLFSAVKQLARGDLKSFSEVVDTQFHKRAFQNDFAKAVSDQFPLRIQAVQASKAINRLIISGAYAFLPDQAIPADMQSEFYVTRDKQHLLYRPVSFTEEQKQVIDERLANYQYLIETYPQINFSAYYLERLQYSPYHPINDYFNDVDERRSLTYFEENKPDELLFEKNMLNDFEDHVKYYYTSDNHLNIRGMVEIYNEVYDLLKQNYPEISDRVDVKEYVTFPGVQFLGGLARITLFPLEPELFEVAVYDVPPYKIIDDGEEIIYTRSADYWAGTNSFDRYANHYGDYFGLLKSNLEYHSDNGSERNLLYIGDSFSIPIYPMIASHYKNTHFIDPRHDHDYTSARYLPLLDIDDVIIVGDATVLYTDITWLIRP